MKIAVLSDIHFDINTSESDSLEKALISHLKRVSPDYFILAGDLSNNYEKTLYYLEKIQNESGVKVLFVPGNHDLWNIEQPEKTTPFIYEKLKEFEGNICDNSVELNDEWVVMGDTLWYDYSFADRKFSLEDLRTGKFTGRNWKDKIYIDWETGDIEMTNRFIRKLHGQIKKNIGKNIILVSHMLTHPHFTVRNNELWKYFNAYLGTGNLERIYKDYPNIKYSIMGHVHYRKAFKENETEYICNCLNYRKEWFNKKAEDEVNLAMKVMEI